MTSKHLGIMLLILVAMGFVTLGYTAYLIFHNVDTIDIKNFSASAPITVTTPILRPGDVLKYNLQYCKYFDGSPTTHRELVDGQVINLTAGATVPSLPLGCHIIERDVTIPETVNPGFYYLNVILQYDVNPLRTETVHYYTDYFKVVPKNYSSTSVPPAGLQADALPDPTDVPTP